MIQLPFLAAFLVRLFLLRFLVCVWGQLIRRVFVQAPPGIPGAVAIGVAVGVVIRTLRAKKGEAACPLLLSPRREQVAARISLDQHVSLGLVLGIRLEQIAARVSLDERPAFGLFFWRRDNRNGRSGSSSSSSLLDLLLLRGPINLGAQLPGKDVIGECADGGRGGRVEKAIQGVHGGTVLGFQLRGLGWQVEEHTCPQLRWHAGDGETRLAVIRVGQTLRTADFALLWCRVDGAGFGRVSGMHRTDRCLSLHSGHLRDRVRACAALPKKLRHEGSIVTTRTQTLGGVGQPDPGLTGCLRLRVGNLKARYGLSRSLGLLRQLRRQVKHRRHGRGIKQHVLARGWVKVCCGPWGRGSMGSRHRRTVDRVSRSRKVTSIRVAVDTVEIAKGRLRLFKRCVGSRCGRPVIVASKRCPVGLILVRLVKLQPGCGFIVQSVVQHGREGARVVSKLGLDELVSVGPNDVLIRALAGLGRAVRLVKSRLGQSSRLLELGNLRKRHLARDTPRRGLTRTMPWEESEFLRVFGISRGPGHVRNVRGHADGARLAARAEPTPRGTRHGVVRAHDETSR